MGEAEEAGARQRRLVGRLCWCVRRGSVKRCSDKEDGFPYSLLANVALSLDLK